MLIDQRPLRYLGYMEATQAIVSYRVVSVFSYVPTYHQSSLYWNNHKLLDCSDFFWYRNSEIVVMHKFSFWAFRVFFLSLPRSVWLSHSLTWFFQNIGHWLGTYFCQSFYRTEDQTVPHSPHRNILWYDTIISNILPPPRVTLSLALCTCTWWQLHHVPHHVGICFKNVHVISSSSLFSTLKCTKNYTYLLTK